MAGEYRGGARITAGPGADPVLLGNPSASVGTVVVESCAADSSANPSWWADGHWGPWPQGTGRRIVARLPGYFGRLRPGGDLISTVALPSQQTIDYADGVDMPISPESVRQSGQPDPTAPQRDYLTALADAGIHPSNELRALSIGAYVCQARAAGQSDETVWDPWALMVRSEVIETPRAPGEPRDDAGRRHRCRGTSFIATQKLC